MFKTDNPFQYFKSVIHISNSKMGLALEINIFDYAISLFFGGSVGGWVVVNLARFGQVMKKYSQWASNDGMLHTVV